MKFTVPYRIGLDIGIASVGWSVVDLQQDIQQQYRPYKIRDLGVRLFSAYDSDRVGHRRECRLARRTWRRKRLRLDDIKALFERSGLINKEEFQALYKQNTEHLPKEQRALSFTPVQVYLLRKEGLYRKLDREEWVRVLYLLAKRRGFQSNASDVLQKMRKKELQRFYGLTSDQEQESSSENHLENDQKDDAKMLSAVMQNQILRQQRNYRTVGEMLVSDNQYLMRVKVKADQIISLRHRKYKNSKGNYQHTFLRSDYQEEIQTLFNIQRVLGNPFASSKFEKEYLAIWGRQRSFDMGAGKVSENSLSTIEKMVGTCTFEAGEKRAPINSYAGNLFEYAQKLSDLRILAISTEEGQPSDERMLTKDEKDTVLNAVYEQGRDLSYFDIRKILRFSDEEFFKGITYLDKNNKKKQKSKKTMLSSDQDDIPISILEEKEKGVFLRKPFLSVLNEALLSEWMYKMEVYEQETYKIKHGMYLNKFEIKERRKVWREIGKIFSIETLFTIYKFDFLTTHNVMVNGSWINKIENGNMLDGFGEFFAYYKTKQTRMEKLDQAGVHNLLAPIIQWDSILPEITATISMFYDQSSSSEQEKRHLFIRFLLEALSNNVSTGGFLKLSFKAIYNLLPLMLGTQAMNYSQACEKAGYDFRAGNYGSYGNQLYLPMLDSNQFASSPVALRSMNEAISVINHLIRRYGSPESIHIEIARELTKAKEIREEITKQQNNNRDRNQKLRQELIDQGHSEPKGIDIVKLKLLKEQKEQCMYSGKPITLDMFSDRSLEVDHIVPYSISFDDSYENKALVLTEENQQKGNRSGYRYIQEVHPERLTSYLSRVNERGRFSLRKKNNYLIATTHEQERNTLAFFPRDLQDTREATVFLATHIRKNLRFELPDDANQNQDHVLMINGGITAYFRNRWGFVKNRDDVRHHAQDAVIVAVLDHKQLNRTSNLDRWVRKFQTAKANYEWGVDEQGFSFVVDNETGEILHFDDEYISKDFFSKSKKQFYIFLPWKDFRHEVKVRMSNDPMQTMKDLVNPLLFYKNETIYPIFPSRPVEKRRSGEMHKATIRRLQKDGVVVSRELLTSPQIIGNGNVKLREWKKARDLSVEKLVKIRNGVAEHAKGSMLRTDVYSYQKGKKLQYELVSQYVNTPEVILDPKIYEFRFSLFPYNLVRIKGRSGEEGFYYYISTHRDSLVVNLPLGGEKKEVGVGTALLFEKWRVDVLGRKHKIINNQGDEKR